MDRRRAIALLGSVTLTGCGGTPETAVVAGLECAAESYAGPAPRTASRQLIWPIAEAQPRFGKLLADADVLDTAFERLVLTVIPAGIDAAVYRPGLGLWSQRAGWRDKTRGLAVDDKTEFWWASVGKLLTATLLREAADAQALSLDDPVSRWWPQVPQPGLIRLRHLLDHTSGLLSYNHPSLGGDATDQRYQTPDQLLEGPRQRGLLSCPGSVFSYSNTGYLLAARVAELVLGQPFDVLFRQRIALPLGCASLRALTPGEVAANLALPHRADGSVVGVAGLSSLLGAGNVVGSAADWLRAWVGLLAARLDRDPHGRWSMLLPMGLPGSTLWYGRGAMAMDFVDQGQARLWLGHTGGSPDANAVVVWDAQRNAHIAVAVNSDVPAGAVANALLNVLSPTS